MQVIVPVWRRRETLGRLVVALVLLVGVGSCTSGSPSSDTSEPSSPHRARVANPLLSSDGGVRNVTFYYHGKTILKTGQDLSPLGKPGVVVTTPKRNEKETVKAIHATGAKAYRYVQFYWAPDDRAYEGINLDTHPGSAFCRRGDTPLLGRVTQEGGKRVPWHYIDANETAARAALTKILTGLRHAGWDGVMFDRGGAALTNARDAAGVPLWSATSSCTQHPYRRGASFADAYTNMLGLAKQAGLGVILNYGISAFDPKTPLRPDPSDPACRARKRTACATLADTWKNVDVVLNESAAFPKDRQWTNTFLGNQRSERDKRHGRRVLGLITTYTLGGARNQTRANVFYEWARVKLFDIAVAVNTGDGGCPSGGSASGVCNRYGVFPSLVDIRFGRPTGIGPHASSCEAGDRIHCVWSREYSRGVNVLNANARERHGVKVSLPGSRCRYVYDVYSKTPVSDGRCVRQATIDIPPWSGRPLLTSDKSFS